MVVNAIKAGVAQVDITPPVGTPLAGNIYPRISSEVEYPLYVKSLVLSDGGKSIAIVSLDLLTISRKYVDEACELIYKETGIPRKYILISATHTHSGPYSISVFGGELNQSFMAKLPKQISSCVKEAYEELENAEIGFTSTVMSGITHNRRLLDENGSAWNSWLLSREKREKLKPAGPTDDELTILAIRSRNGSLKAIVFNYASHACVTGTTRKISADYPGAVAKYLSEKLGSDLITLFLPGACGDVNFNYELPLDKIAETIGSGILSAINRVKYTNICKLDAFLKEVTLPIRNLSELQWEEILLKWSNAIEIFKKEHEKIILERDEKIKTFALK